MSEQLDLNPGDRVLVSRTDRLGDLILALPFVETLKLRYPECRVDVLASLYASPILENNPHIDGILRVQNDQLSTSRHYKKEMAHKIVKGKYRVAVALYPERLISRLLYKCEIPERIGTAGRFHSVYFNHRLLHSRKANKKHESEYNLDFLRYFRKGDTVKAPRVYPTEKENLNAERILRNAGVDDGFVVIHPGSGGSAERWPVEHFLQLYERLEKSGRQVIVTGSESEGEMVDAICAQTGIRVNKITGETDLRTLGAVLARASAVVANSTGPLHLAVAVGTKVVGLFPGRRIMSPVRWGPVGKGHRVLQPATAECTCPPLECSCMKTIDVEMVAEAVESIYGNA